MTNEINTYMKPEELEDMTTLTIKTNALDNNIRIIKRLANGAKVIAVLKGNAYGLGLQNLHRSYNQRVSITMV